MRMPSASHPKIAHSHQSGSQKLAQSAIDLAIELTFSFRCRRTANVTLGVSHIAIATAAGSRPVQLAIFLQGHAPRR